MKLRFQTGSRMELANRKTSRFWTGSLPRKWSMRKIARSGKRALRISFSSRADARSCPKGFSRTTRPRSLIPAEASPSTTVSNMLGGMAR